MACTGLSAETGALANFAVVKESQLAVLPDTVSDIEGALIEPATVAAYGVDWAGVTGGDIVLVTGAGPIGVLSAMYASAIGAATVVIAEPNPNRAALARAMDIGPVVDPTADGFADYIAGLTDGIGVDLAVECSGTTPGLTSAISSTRSRGQVVQTGLHTKPATVDMMEVANREITIRGSWCYNLTDWPRVIRLVAAGKYPVAKAVTTTIDLADVVTKGFDVLVDPTGDQLKVLVNSK
jgi:(R,R)-butanediol dehydrogenase/meso-butanediol dehydrogenase/diacetyl reductase